MWGAAGDGGPSECIVFTGFLHDFGVGAFPGPQNYTLLTGFIRLWGFALFWASQLLIFVSVYKGFEIWAFRGLQDTPFSSRFIGCLGSALLGTSGLPISDRFYRVSGVGVLGIHKTIQIRQCLLGFRGRGFPRFAHPSPSRPPPMKVRGP